MHTKFCASCKLNKPLDQFHKNKRKRDGLASECKTCKIAASNAHYHANRDEICAADRAKRAPFLKPVIIRQPVRRDDGAFDVPLTKGMFAIVDEADLPLIAGYNWSAQKGRNTFYAVRNEKGRLMGMHNTIMQVDRSVIVDHLNGNGLNNRRSNLRVATHSQNLQNADPWGAIEFRGVHSRTYRSGKVVYSANIHTGNKKISLGVHPTPEDAARAYDREAMRLYGEHARLNFPAQGATP